MTMPRTSGQYQTFQFDPGSNATKKMRELFPWMSERQIQEYALPSFEDTNYMMEDKGKVYPGINYEVEDFQKPLPRYPEDRGDISFPAVDIQARAAKMASEQDYQKSLSTEEMDREYQKEYDSLSGLNVFGRMMGLNVGGMPTYQSVGGAATKTASVKDIADNEFMQHFYKTINAIPGNKMSPQEILMFLESTKATPDQVATLMKLKDLIKLDGIIQLQRINDNPNSADFGDVEYRWVWEYGAEDAKRGWMKDAEDLKFQISIAKDQAAAKKETDLGELERTIIALPRASDDANADLAPNNREEYNALAQSLGLRLPSEFAVLEKHFGDLLKPQDKKTWVNVHEGKTKFHRFTDYEAAKYNKDNPKNKVVPSGSGIGIATTQNSERIAEVIQREVKAANTHTGPPGTPAPSFFKTWSNIQAAIAADQSIAVGGTGNNWKDIQERAKAAYSGDERKEAEVSNQVLKTRTGLESLQGRPYPAVAKWLNVNNITDTTIRSGFIQDWEKLNPLAKYSGPAMLFSDEGGKSGEIKSWSEFELLINDYPWSEYKDVPRKPTMRIDYGAVNQGDDTFLAEGWETRKKKDSEETERVWVSQPRWTKDGATRRLDRLKADMKESIKSIDLVRGNASKILTALAKKKGTMDGFTFKWIEKMLDPTGVVRQSDVEFIEGFGDQLERARTWLTRHKGLWDAQGDGASVKISDELRKDFADAIITVFNEVHKSNVEQLEWIKGDFDHLQKKHPSQYGGALEWADVINPKRYQTYMDYEEQANSLYSTFLTKVGGEQDGSNTSTGETGNAQFAVPKRLRR